MCIRDRYTFGGWLAFALKRNYLKPYVSHLFHPYIYIAGITDDWRKQNHLKMFGTSSVIPRNARILFLYGKNDPVITYGYLAKFVLDTKLHSNTIVDENIFEDCRHGMSLMDCPEAYKQNVRSLLSKVPEWGLHSNQ